MSFSFSLQTPSLSLIIHQILLMQMNSIKRLLPLEDEMIAGADAVGAAGRLIAVSCSSARLRCDEHVVIAAVRIINGRLCVLVNVHTAHIHNIL